MCLRFSRSLCLPRMRGDRPLASGMLPAGELFTPHARGSTSKAGTSSFDSLVYPACAGIDLSERLPQPLPKRLPRMRGDRPSLPLPLLSELEFTPHARGSTYVDQALCYQQQVYPACAGIDLVHLTVPSSRQCLPRMRGDRPSGR